MGGIRRLRERLVFLRKEKTREPMLHESREETEDGGVRVEGGKEVRGRRSNQNRFRLRIP